jgi:peptidoglycan/LPS O-acetylase OafA/YrhL
VSDGAQTSAARTKRGFRRDIQGIRGVAVALVLGSHAGLPGFSGGFVGLDVFYVLSGFLITGLLVSELERTGRVSLRDFYARRARRLLPLAGTVLLATLLGALVLFPASRLHEVSDDALAAALYVANWHFMAQQVDYFAGDGVASPIQHYWSLSVEEQFYVVWPVLLLGLGVLAARLGLRRRGVLLAALLAIGASSLAYSVLFSAADPARAYFSTFTRAWELAAGAALALLLPLGLRLPRAVATGLGAAGLAAMLGASATFTEGVDYPSWRAVVPVAGTLAVIVAGTSVRMTAPIRILATAPMQTLGRLSYSWYLWHWPAVVFAESAWGPLGVRERVLATLAAGVPTVVSHHLIEERFRRSRTIAARPRRSIALGAGSMAVAIALAALVVVVRPGVATAPAGTVTGATGDVVKLQPSVDAIRPSLDTARKDRGPIFDACLVQGKDRVSPPCVYGDADSETTVVLFGDSHAEQYSTALVPIAQRRGWRLVVLARASCPIGQVDYQPTCNAWREGTLRRIVREERPDLIIASNATDRRFKVKVGGRRLTRRASQPLLEKGYARTYRTLTDTGARLVVIRDQARTPFGVTECVSEHPDDLRRCAFAPHRPVRNAFDARGARMAGRDIKVIDPMLLLCPRDGAGRVCPAVVGDVLVYRDTYHLSATFARTIGDWLAPRLPDV